MTIATRVRPADLVLPVILGLAVSGCGPSPSSSTTQPEAPVPTGQAPAAGTPDIPRAYPRSQINDPRLSALASKLRDWILQQQSAGPEPLPLFSRVEILPTTQTVLPYGVGAYEQEPRLPVIVTTGPGWAGRELDEKEAITARLYGELSRRLEAMAAKPLIRPTLTIQTASGLELAWINDLVPGRKNLHGDEGPVETAAAPRPRRAAAGVRAAAVATDRRGEGDESPC